MLIAPTVLASLEPEAATDWLLFLPPGTVRVTWNTLARNPSAASREILSHDGADVVDLSDFPDMEEVLFFDLD